MRENRTRTVGLGLMSPAGRSGSGMADHVTRRPVRRGVRGELPSRLPSTQAEPSRRGPWRPGRSYSGALHLDARNHARSTVCGSTADGMAARTVVVPAGSNAPAPGDKVPARGRNG
jgi:hypothetical protein